MLSALIYFAVIGVVFFIFGRVMPKDRIDPRAFPFRLYAFEKDGTVYRSLLVHRWQNHVPDMSRILPHMMPEKKLGTHFDLQTVQALLAENCTAELIHWLLCVAGLFCLKLCPGMGGVVLYALYFLGNLPYIIIQRYNRPKLIRLQERLQQREVRKGACVCVF